MDIPVWFIVVVIVGLAVYFMTMRGFFSKSREADRKTDYSKIPPLKDEDD